MEHSFPHVILLLFKSGFLAASPLLALLHAYPHASHLHRKWHCLHDMPFQDLHLPNPCWKTQTEIDNDRVNLRMSCLLHFNCDLAAVHCYIGGEHVGAHHNPDVILSCISHLITPDDATHLHRILTDGSLALFNATGTQREFQEFYKYGNYKSVTARARRSWKL